MTTESLSGKISRIEKELEEVKSGLSKNKDRFREAAGSWSDFDSEEFKEKIKDERSNSVSDKVEL